jgi:hypothetical protein
VNRLTAQLKVLSVAAALPWTATTSAQEELPSKVPSLISHSNETTPTTSSFSSELALEMDAHHSRLFSQPFEIPNFFYEQILPSPECLALRLKNLPTEFWTKVVERAVAVNHSPIDCLCYQLKKLNQTPANTLDSTIFPNSMFSNTKLADSVLSNPQVQTTIKEKLFEALKQVELSSLTWWLDTINEAEKSSMSWLACPPRYLVDRLAFKKDARLMVINTLLDLDLSDLQLLFSSYSKDKCLQDKLDFIIKKRLGDSAPMQALFGAYDVRPTCQSIWSNIYNNAIRTKDPEIIAAAEPIRTALNMEIYRIERFSLESLQEIIAAREAFFSPTPSVNTSQKFAICFYPASDNSSAFSYNTTQYPGQTHGLLRAALQSNSVRPVYFEIANDDDLKLAFQKCTLSKNMPNVIYVELSGHGSVSGQDLAWTEAPDNQKGYLSFTARERPSVIRQMQKFLSSSKGSIQAVILSSCYSYRDPNCLSQQLSTKLEAKVIALQESGLIPIKLNPNANWELALSGHSVYNCSTVTLKSGKVIEQIARAKQE